MTGFRFDCTLCGDCCTGDQVVRLTGGDLRLLVDRLGLSSVHELKDRGLVQLIREPMGGGRFVWRPRIRFRTKPRRECPFLVNDVDEADVYRGLCSLHPSDKPLVCALSPLAREVETVGSTVKETWSFVPPVEGCPGVGRGEPLPLAPPPDLRERLDSEVRWMRRLIDETGGLPDQSSAWDWLAGLEA